MKSAVFVAAALIALADAMPENMWSVRRWSHEKMDRRLVKGTQQPVEPAQEGVATVQGCYKSAGSLELKGTFEWNSVQKCSDQTCTPAGSAVAGTSRGSQCFCGDKYPPKEDLVDPKFCDTGCTGYGDHACGGIGYWTIYNTGVTIDVENEEGTADKSTSSSSTAAPTHTETKVEQTLVVTATPTNAPENDEGGGGTNVGGIVAGVVVGVVVIASLIGGGFLYMRRKRNKEIEEEHRRNAAVNAFIGKPPGSSAGSTSDSRLDPVMAHRRMSDGSIADNQDYSRRILRVTNA